MKLNTKQAEAVERIEGPVMVLAGPGTGKTQIIAARIAEILGKTQMDPHNILALTFTESGVVAMRERLMKQIGPAAYGVQIYTFHSLCNEIIQDHPEHFLFARDLQSLTEVEQVQILRKALDSRSADSPLKPFGSPYFYVGDLRRVIQTLKREGISPDELNQRLSEIEDFIHDYGAGIEAFVARHGRTLKAEELFELQDWLSGSPLDFIFQEGEDLEEGKVRTQVKNRLKKEWISLTKQISKQRELLAIYEAYQAALKERGRYDFDDMILFVVQRFEEDSNFLAQYQEQFQYILVDEYQDTNGAQNKLVFLLASYFEAPNLFVVGDDKQSIYRFQGASLENILEFIQRYQGQLRMVSLEDNYRSQQGILDAAQISINHSQESLAQHLPEHQGELTAHNSYEVAPLRIASFADTKAELQFLVQELQARIEEGVEPHEIAILYRSNREALALREALLQAQLPFRMESGENLLDDPDIMKVVELLRFLANPFDSRRLFHLLHFEQFNCATLDVLKLAHRVGKERRDLFDQLSNEELLREAGVDNLVPFQAFQARALDWIQHAENQSVVSLLERVLNEGNFVQKALEAPDKLERLNKLQSFFSWVREENRAHPRLRLEQLIENLDLLTEHDLPLKESELKVRGNAIRLMTAHKSKGLEFDHVYLYNVSDRKWGRARRGERLALPANLLKHRHQQDPVEDDRRLFFVALTRARKQVTLTYAKESETGRAQSPSLFVQELLEAEPVLIEGEEKEEATLERLHQSLSPRPQKQSLAEEDFVRGLLQNYKMSITHLNNYLKCPRLFYFNNVLRIPRAKSKFEAYGTAVHESLKDLTLRATEEGLYEQDYLLEQFERYLKREALSEQDFRGGLELGRKQLTDYFEHYAPDRPLHVLPEYNFSSHGVEFEGVPLTGKLDAIEFLDEEQKIVHVVDYKTGSPDNKSAALQKNGDYRRQIAFYKLLCDESKQFPFTMYSGEIRFIQKSARDESFKRYVFEVEKDEMEILKGQILDVYQDIQSLRFLHVEDWECCDECEYCELYSSNLRKSA